jgi:23S rRNA pseudouridine2605 synthase
MPTSRTKKPALRSSTGHTRPGHVTLERALSKLGLASRTQARALIEAGRVKVNGVVKTHPLFLVRPETVRIEIDGQATQAVEQFRTLALHKIRGVITTHSDEKGRPTVFSLIDPAVLKSLPGLHAVGRLDAATTGLLLLTNDTLLSAWLTEPENEVPRIYIVTVRGEVTEPTLKRIHEGVTDEGEHLHADRATLRKASGKESHLTLELRQGKNREIRRLLAALGHEVTKLKRVAYGALELGDLPAGGYRELTAFELRSAFPLAPIRDTRKP